jgi:hypothetical protein
MCSSDQGQAMNEMTCEEFRQLDAEVALGVTDARDRTAGVAHLDHCPSCRRELRQLSDLADALAVLSPAVEPPAGFESRLLARLGEEEQPAPRRVLHRRPLLVAAAAVLALAIGATGWVIGDASRPAPAVATGQVVMASLAADHHPVGQVVIDTGSDPWISMALSIGDRDTPVQCQLRESNGRVITVGWFSLSKGYGYWAAPITLSTDTTLDAAQVSDAQGRVLATAPLHGTRLVATTSS